MFFNIFLWVLFLMGNFVEMNKGKNDLYWFKVVTSYISKNIYIYVSFTQK